MSGTATGLGPSPLWSSSTPTPPNPPGLRRCTASRKSKKPRSEINVLNSVCLVWYSGRGYAASTANYRAFTGIYLYSCLWSGGKTHYVCQPGGCEIHASHAGRRAQRHRKTSLRADQPRAREERPSTSNLGRGRLSDGPDPFREH